tara:strand:- start:18655 stop:19119 length:465 start_codon:yes stop_codon:yes gene_type:complete
MQIYTEVNYEWKDGVLVEQSSKSYNYTGEVSLCKGGSKPHEVIDHVINEVADTGTGAVEAVQDPASFIEEGPGGTTGQVVDQLYSGTTKDIIEQAQGKAADVAQAVQGESPEDYIRQEGSGIVAMGGRKEARARAMTSTGSIGASRLTSAMPTA